MKSFVWEKKFHAYLTHETLPAEERVSKFHNHGKKTSCQTFAEASKRKFVPKSNGSTVEGINEKAPVRLETGTECHDHPREIVGRSQPNCYNNMADCAI